MNWCIDEGACRHVTVTASDMHSVKLKIWLTDVKAGCAFALLNLAMLLSDLLLSQSELEEAWLANNRGDRLVEHRQGRL